MQLDFPSIILGDDAGILEIEEVFVLEPLEFAITSAARC
jgi:hypothetical protein